jgi:hypothetical protein
MKIFDELGHEAYASTLISKFLAIPPVAGGYKFMSVPLSSHLSGLFNVLNLCTGSAKPPNP